MSKEGEFLIYCIEIYKYAKAATGREVVRIFEKYDVFDYIRKYFDALHTTGEKYIINDIDLYIKECQTA